MLPKAKKERKKERITSQFESKSQDEQNFTNLNINLISTIYVVTTFRFLFKTGAESITSRTRLMCLEFRAVKWSRPCFLQASSHQSNKARWTCKAINLGTRNLSPGQSLGARPWYSLTQVCDWLLHTWLNGPKNHPATQVRPSFYTRWRALSLMSVRGFAKTNRPRLGYAEPCSRPDLKVWTHLPSS